MQKFYLHVRIILRFTLFLLISIKTVGQAPQLKIRNFAVFGGFPSAGNIASFYIDSTKYGVKIDSAAIINNGAVGSHTFIATSALVIFRSDIYSGHSIEFGNSNKISGSVTASIKGNQNRPVITTFGNNTIFGNTPPYGSNPGDLIANGGISVGLNNVVNGAVRIPATNSYSGPQPAQGIFNNPTFPQLPTSPTDLNPTTTGVVGPNITASTTIAPGKHGDILIAGNQTIKFDGTGQYVFNSIKSTSTTANTFELDFKNNQTGVFQIYVVGDVDLKNIKVKMSNGGSAARVYTEVHGSGSSNNGFAFAIDGDPASNQKSNWEGTVWVPGAKLRVGAAITKVIFGATVIIDTAVVVNGCLWSGEMVRIDKSVTINYVPMSTSADPAQTPTSDIVPYYPPPADGKVYDVIDASLQSIYENYNPANPPSDTDFVYRSKYPGEIFVEVVAKAGQYAILRDQLVAQGYGLRDTITNGDGTLTLTGSFPVQNLYKLNLPPIAQYIDYVKPLYLPIANGGLAETLGDSSVYAGVTRRSYNVTGSGIRVGVLSDSYAMAPAHPLTTPLSEDLGRDLPIADSIQLLGDYFTRGTDEGRAMMQIIHDVAPGARLAFKTGFISPGDMALGIHRLATEANCDIIVEDVTHVTEPFLKDGVIARAVDDIVTHNNVTYFSSAGNFGNKAFDGQFHGIPAPPGFTGLAHDFGGGNYLQPVTLRPGDYTIVLQWEDNIYSLAETPGALNDLDIYLVDNAGNILFGFNRVNIGRDPIEVLPFTVNGTADRAANIIIAGAPGTTTNLKFKYVVFRGRLTFNDYPGASTLVGQANAVNAIAVGAIKYDQTPAFGITPTISNMETYSSLGGTAVNNINRYKPDLIAPDGVNVMINMGRDTDGDAPPLGRSTPDNISNFFGTSAAVPHAAAVAALIKEAKQRFTSSGFSPAQLKNLLKSSAVRIGGRDYTPEAGAGLINAEAAMSTFASPLPHIAELHVVEPGITPGRAPFTVAVHGDHFQRSSVIYFADQAWPTTFVNANELTASIPVFTGSAMYPGNPSVQVYNPPLVNGQSDGGYSDKRYFFENGKKNVIVAVQNAIRKFGERNPTFQSTITVDGQSLGAANLTAAQLKLDNLLYSTSVNNSSSIGQYSISVSNPLDPNNADDQLLLTQYNYSFVPGRLQIQKLPVTITARSFTMTYGEFPNQIAYDYTFDRTNITDPVAFEQALRTQHRNLVADNALAVLNNYNSVIPPIQASDLSNMSMMASYQSFKNARKFILQNDRLVPLTAAVANNQIGLQRYLVDVSAQSINDYKNNNNQLTLVPAFSAGALRGLINSRIAAAAHVQTISNGQTLTLLNGDLLTMATGQLLSSLSNGQTLTLSNNGSLVPLNNGELITSSDNTNYQPLANGQLVVMQNGQFQLVQSVTVTASGEVRATLSNGQTLTISNGELLTLSGGQLVTITNNQLLMMADNQLLTLASGQTLTLSNGQTLTLSNGQTLTLANSELTALFNGQTLTLSNGQTLTLSNGQTLTLSNGETFTLSNNQTLTLSNGQTLTLSNSELTALLNGQTLTLSNGQTLTLSNGQTLTISNGQTLTLSNGQTLTLSNGELLTLSNGQTLTLSNSELTALFNGQTLTLSNGQTLTLSNGQTLTLSNGQTLTLSNNQTITLSNGQTLTLSNSELTALLNGQTLTLSNGQTLTLSNGQTLTISNGQTLTLSNGEPFVVVNGQIELVNSLQINAAGNELTYTLSNGQTLTISNGGQLLSFSNGELVSISNNQLLTLSNGQTLTLSNTELLALSNGQTVTLSNGLTLTLSNGQTLTISNTTNIGSANSNTKAMVVVDQADLTTQRGALAGLFSVNMITGLDVGVQQLIPGTLVNGNYEISYEPATVNITPQEISITADSKTKIYGEADPPLTYQITAGSLIGSDAISGSLNRLLGEGAAAYAINQGTVHLTTNYTLHFVPGNLTINPKGLTAGFTVSNKVYDGNTNAIITSRTLTGVVGSDDVNLGSSGNASFENKNTGNGKVVTCTNFVLNGASASNYILTPTIANAVANITAKQIAAGFIANNKTYDGNTAAVISTRTLSGVIGSDLVNLGSSGTAIFQDKNAGLAKLVTATGFSLTGTSATNYVLSSPSATTTANISPAPLTITADLKYINQGSLLPQFTSTLVGLISGEQITGILYSASSVNTSIAGVYDNVPSLAASAYPNYTKTFNKGKLYINPYGSDAKKIKIKMDCVEQVASNPSGFKYVAHFSYDNKNNSAYYVPIGADNQILAAGSYGGSQPEVFLKDENNFTIPFDGKTLSWTLTTNDKTKKTQEATEAKSSSNKCNNANYRIITSTENETAEVEVAAIGKSQIYPNPVHNNLTLTSASIIASEKDVTISDVSGRIMQLKGLKRVSANVIEINVSALQDGVYFLRVQTKAGLQIFRFVKL